MDKEVDIYRAEIRQWKKIPEYSSHFYHFYEIRIFLNDVEVRRDSDNNLCITDHFPLWPRRIHLSFKAEKMLREARRKKTKKLINSKDNAKVSGFERKVKRRA